MKGRGEQNQSKRRYGKAWLYVVIVLINAAIFFGAGFIYMESNKSYSQKLYDENLHNLTNVNVASAGAAEMYIASMGVKLDDAVAYLEAEDMSLAEATDYLGSTNTNVDQQFQLILCGRLENGAVAYGDYSGKSVRKLKNADGTLTTSVREISYKNGYVDLARTLRDLNDEAFEGVCFAPEFTDADTKLKCFAIYRHVTLEDAEGEGRYAILLSVNSQTAQNAYHAQDGGQSRATVLMNKNGDYIINNNDFKGVNFYDYLRTYNGLSMDQRVALESYVLDTVGDGRTDVSVNLFYKNHESVDCVFCITGMANDWYSITSMPQSSFRIKDGGPNYSLIILLLFIVLFVVDGIVFYFIGKAMRHNVIVAEKAMEASDNANQAKSSFLSTMSHELRTPLNAIIGYNVIARDAIAAWKQQPKPEDITELDTNLNKSGIASKHLLSIINDVLDMATIENGKIRLVNAPFDFRELIDSIDALFVTMAKNNGVHFTVEKDVESWEWLSGDKTRINQIFVNLLNNAIKFTPAGGSVNCGITVKHAGDHDMSLHFSVEDTGIGMSEEFLKDLWTPFVQADATVSKRFGGTGLGLAITKSLVGMMGGGITVASRLGEGTRFDVSFSLPRAEPDATKTRKEQERRKADFGGMTVLTAEDNAMNREIMKKILSSVHCTVIEAVNGQEAVDKFIASEPYAIKAILMDVHMPVKDGYTATAEIRALSRFDAASVPIIALTADAFSEDVEKSIRLGMNRHLSKPINIALLIETLSEISGQKQ